MHPGIDGTSSAPLRHQTIDDTSSAPLRHQRFFVASEGHAE